MPSFLCGQMSWSLFGLGRRMFEENLYDAIPPIIELFLQSFHSWAGEGSVFLLVPKPWRSWHHHSPLQDGMPWDSAGSFISLCQWIYIFFPTVPHGYSFSVEDEWLEYRVWAHHEAVAQQQGRGEAPRAHLEPHSCPRVSLCPNHFSLICPWPGTQFWKWLSCLCKNPVKTLGKWGILLVLSGLLGCLRVWFCLVVPVLVLVLSQWKSELPLISKIKRYRIHLFPF